MKKVAIYARYSSSKQREQSIEGQIRVCKAFCATKNSWSVVRTYIDRARSGRNDNRPEFQKMLSDAPSGAFDIVLVYQLDRFARNTFDSRKNETYLSKYGIRVMSATEPVTSEDDETHEDNFLARGIVELFAENFSRDLSRKVKRGMRETYYKRKVAQVLPFGYQKDGDHVVLNPNEVPVVKYIFDSRCAGVTLPELAYELKKQGVTRSNGNYLCKNTIDRIIKNPKYTGSFVNPFDPEDIIDDMFPAIVSEEVYRKANSIHGTKHTKHIRENSDMPLYALTGKLFDEESGLPFKGKLGKTQAKNGGYRYYVCKTDKTISLNKEAVENEVYERLIDVFTDDSNLKSIAKQLTSVSSEEKDSVEYTKLLSERNKIVREQSKLADAFMNANPEMFALLNNKASELKAKLDLLDEKIANLKTNNSFKFYDEEIVIKELKNALLFKKNDEEFKYRALNMLINSIYYNKNEQKMTIYCSLKDESKITHEEHLQNIGKIKGEPSLKVRRMRSLVNQNSHLANFFIAQRDMFAIIFQ